MSNESIEVQLAILAERVSTVIEDNKESKITRKAQYDSIEAIRAAVGTVNNRVGNLETQMSAAKPTIEEFITIKHKVVGAGALGKWLWAAGAALLGFVAASRETIFHWFSGK